ncbi:DUF3306 domain-containing protein [Magnetospirillum sp. SS-4]|uniref:DUF3306 domain-containing protein n=1 Tax=Magnetospirillum sp. SS-4 TaxID=2681465 RepID=UPI0013855F01|nr:DUF3306 domain-containing protein [Magnetospirillum sp. SS-4]CAA7626310.1 conserved hypothetical protein [Magnetospirillum sp. SS-4]
MSESVLGRWSRRKLAAKADPPSAPSEEEVVATAGEPACSERSPAAEPQPMELPPVESLEADSDYSVFMKPGVPAELRQQALTRLWATNPGLMQPEVMDLHVGDYTSPVVAEVVKTAWRLGKGVLDAAELAAEEEERRQATAAKRLDDDA